MTASSEGSTTLSGLPVRPRRSGFLIFEPVSKVYDDGSRPPTSGSAFVAVRDAFDDLHERSSSAAAIALPRTGVMIIEAAPVEVAPVGAARSTASRRPSPTDNRAASANCGDGLLAMMQPNDSDGRCRRSKTAERTGIEAPSLAAAARGKPAGGEAAVTAAAIRGDGDGDGKLVAQLVGRRRQLSSRPKTDEPSTGPGLWGRVCRLAASAIGALPLFWSRRLYVARLFKDVATEWWSGGGSLGRMQDEGESDLEGRDGAEGDADDVERGAIDDGGSRMEVEQRIEIHGSIASSDGRRCNRAQRNGCVADKDVGDVAWISDAGGGEEDETDVASLLWRDEELLDWMEPIGVEFLARVQEQLGMEKSQEFNAALESAFVRHDKEGRVDLQYVSMAIESCLQGSPQLQCELRKLQGACSSWGDLKEIHRSSSPDRATTSCYQETPRVLQSIQSSTSEQPETRRFSSLFPNTLLDSDSHERKGAAIPKKHKRNLSNPEKNIMRLRKQMRREGLRLGNFQDVVTWLVPHGRGRHTIVFTVVYAMVVVTLFAFMAGRYPAYEVAHADEQSREELLAIDKATPLYLCQWVTFSKDRSFSFEYLLHWGGRYGPKINDGEWWRWFVSPLIHQNFQHLLANVLLIMALAGHLEHNYGAWRIALVLLLSSTGGNLMSAAFEDGCILVVGASGAVFGFMGLFVADAILNFESITRPWLRIAVMMAFVVFFVFTMFASRDGVSVSHFSHIGGLLCGLFPSVIFMPNVKRCRWEMATGLSMQLGLSEGLCSQTSSTGASTVRNQCNGHEKSFWAKFPIHPFTVLGLIVLLFVFVALPIYLYKAKLPRTSCDSEQEELASLFLRATLLEWQ